MPLPMQIMSNIIPAKWFIVIVKAIMLKVLASNIFERNTNFSGMALLFISFKYQKYKIRLE